MPRAPQALPLVRPTDSAGTVRVNISVLSGGMDADMGLLRMRSPGLPVFSGSSQLVRALRRISARSARKRSIVPGEMVSAVAFSMVTVTVRSWPALRGSSVVGATVTLTELADASLGVRVVAVAEVDAAVDAVADAGRPPAVTGRTPARRPITTALSGLFTLDQRLRSTAWSTGRFVCTSSATM